MEEMSRRRVVKHSVFGLLGLIVGLLLPSKRAEAGYGRCGKCPCQAFSGYGNQCTNCGHRFSDHY